MISLKSRVVTPLGDSNGGNKFTSDYLSTSSSSPFSNRLYFTGVGQRPSSSLYAKGRLLASSSVERLNRSDSPPPSANFRGGSSWDLRSSSPMRRPRNPSVDRLRRPEHRSSYRSASRDELSSLDSSSTSNLSGLAHHHAPSSSIMERRNMIISNFNRNLPPIGLATATFITHHHHHPHHNLHPRSNFAASRNNLPQPSSSSSTGRSWPSTKVEFFRPRIRDRPSLASIKSTLKGRVKPVDKAPVSRYVKPSTTSTLTSSTSSASTDASLRLSRYRNVIKFREFHIDEPLTKRKASISWELPLETISSSSSYNSKSSGNSQSSPRSRQPSPDKDPPLITVKAQSETQPSSEPEPSKELTSSTSSPQSLIGRRNSLSRSDQRSPKLKVPKLEITPDSMKQTSLSPEIIELPKPLPKGRQVKPHPSEKERPAPRVPGKQYLHHHRKPSSPDLSRGSPSPIDSPRSSRPPSPSPTSMLTIEEKSRKILSKSGSTSPNPMGSNSSINSERNNNSSKLSSASMNGIGINRTNNSSSSVTAQNVISPKQESKLSIATDSSSSSGLKVTGNMSPTTSSLPPSPRASSSSSKTVTPNEIPAKTTTNRTNLSPAKVPSISSSSSSSSSPSSVPISSPPTEAKSKGPIICEVSKETGETKKRSLTPNQPNNRSSSPSLPSASSSPSTPPSKLNQATSVGFESSPKVDPSSRKISPTPSPPPPQTPPNSRSSPMPKSTNERVKVNLNSPITSKTSSTPSSKPSTPPIANTKMSSPSTQKSLKSSAKSTSCPPTPTDSLPSYFVKVKPSSTGNKSADRSTQQSDKSTFSSNPSSPRVIQGAGSSSVNPLLPRLTSKRPSVELVPNVKQASPRRSVSSSVGSNRSSKNTKPEVNAQITRFGCTGSRKSSEKSSDRTESLKKKISAQLQSNERVNNKSTPDQLGKVANNETSTSPLPGDKNPTGPFNSLPRRSINAKENADRKLSGSKITEKPKSVESELLPKPINSKETESSADRLQSNGRESVKGRKESAQKSDDKPNHIKPPTIKAESQPDKGQPLNQQSKDGDQIKSLDQLLDKSEEPSIEDNNKKKERKRIRFRTYTMDDFDLRRVLGRGSFGKVYLAQLKGHDVFFAIKFLKKHVVIEDDDLESIMVERKVLALGVKHPFICKLFCTFQTRGMVCFVMEFLAGGDLMFHVQSCGRFPEDRARFYAAEIVSALTFLHSRYIIYRDLKLDNILLDSEGHIRLVDFGMCQCHIWKEECLPSNFCGTPEYMAPEIIKGVQYNQAVDWWSFGVLLYEMIVGDSPFKATDEDELLWNVCYEKVRIPYFVSQNAQSIILNLLERDPVERLGMPTSSKGDIRSQKFFEPVNWEAINAGKVKPPFLPNLKHSSDVCYFDREFTEMRPVLTPIDDYTVESVDHELFFGFDYTNPNMTD